MAANAEYAYPANEVPAKAGKKKLSIADKVKALVTCEIAVYGKLTKKTFNIVDDLNEVDHADRGGRFTVEVHPPLDRGDTEPSSYHYSVYPSRQCVKSGYVKLT